MGVPRPYLASAVPCRAHSMAVARARNCSQPIKALSGESLLSTIYRAFPVLLVGHIIGDRAVITSFGNGGRRISMNKSALAVQTIYDLLSEHDCEMIRVWLL